LLALIASQFGWQGVSIAVTLVVVTMLPVVAMLLPESPAHIGVGPYGAAASVSVPARAANPFGVAITALRRASRSIDFWLLTLSFAICGLSTNGLINTHLIAYCGDHGIPEVNSATMLAIIGAFSLIGSAASGWLCDRFNPRFLLFWYYGLRGLSLALIPFSQFDVVSLSIFSVFYGLDWVATGPPTVALTNQVFGRREAPVIVAWIFAGHQVGGGIAALGAGFVRSATGDYLLAFLISGLVCLLASMLVLRIGRPQPVIAAAD
jgi:predicted MFS family arabinose efflux permease